MRASHHPLNVSPVLKNIGKNMPRLSSIIRNNWLPRTAIVRELVRKALYPLAHGAVMQAREQSEDLADEIRKAKDKVVATYGGGKSLWKPKRRPELPWMQWGTNRERCRRH